MKIDLDKFIASLIKNGGMMSAGVHKALEEQGLAYNATTEEIVSVGKEKSNALRAIRNIEKVFGWYYSTLREKTLMPDELQEVKEWLREQKKKCKED